ncbi:uncharacterized protein LOC114334695 [Diabrotica virgifera virgifera]|uniref:Uncharacterized protein LOC114334695 n=1 Tax=Diabrotica virgifera virgifera TaxID=50390 RepID=A0A6P7G7U3_DIAVI|nr:uncharacterized protein LOC114334695 [Diabrotica virgifera virgifera]
MANKKTNNPEFLRQFIDIYQSNPCLWKVKDKCYTNRDLREKAYQQLINLYKTVNVEASQETVRSKINNLRSAFRKELKKVQKSKRSGASTEDIYTPGLWYYELLLFTANQEESSETVSSINSSDDEVEDKENENVSTEMITVQCISPESSMEHDSAPLLSPTSNRISTYSNTTRKGKKTKREELLDAAYKTLATVDDECSSIGMTIAFKLRRMNERQRNIAEYLINQILFFGVQDKLDEATYIAYSTPPQIEPTPSTQYVKQEQIFDPCV